MFFLTRSSMMPRRNFLNSASNSFSNFTNPYLTSGLDQYVELNNMLYCNNVSLHRVQFIQKFLDDYVIPTDIIISDDTWKEFFNYVCRASQYHSCIAEFLKRVAQKYLESGREVHFIFDLLKLTINDFLSGNNLYSYQVI